MQDIKSKESLRKHQKASSHAESIWGLLSVWHFS